MPKPAATTVTLHAASEQELSCIENMMQFYNYELSQWYPIEFASNGFYGIRSKAQYWAHPHVKPFLLRCRGHLAGFAVVDDEVVHPPSQYNLGYFFVTRRYRGRGAGTAIFSELLKRFPGAWEVYHLAQNEAAARFWSLALARGGLIDLVVSNEVIHDGASVLYRFTTAGT